MTRESRTPSLLYVPAYLVMVAATFTALSAPVSWLLSTEAHALAGAGDGARGFFVFVAIILAIILTFLALLAGTLLLPMQALRAFARIDQAIDRRIAAKETEAGS